jgi:heat shock protein HslJ
MRIIFAFAMLVLLGCTPIATADKNVPETAVDSDAPKLDAPKLDAPILPLKSFEGSAWSIKSINGISTNNINLPAPATLEFANGNAVGSSGCNSYGGLYLQIGTKLFFGRSISTEVGCPGDQEKTLYRLLSGQVDSKFASDGKLYLTKGDDRAVLVRTEKCITCGEPAISAPVLSGPKWQIQAINGAIPFGLNVFKNTANYAVQFGDDSFQFRAGCNTTRASYRSEGNQLFTNIGVSTVIGCSPELRAQDRLITAIFAANPILVFGPNMDMLLASEAGMVELQGPPSQRK